MFSVCAAAHRQPGDGAMRPVAQNAVVLLDVGLQILGEILAELIHLAFEASDRRAAEAKRARCGRPA